MANYTEELLKKSNQPLPSADRVRPHPSLPRAGGGWQPKRRASTFISWFVMLLVIGGIVAAAFLSESEDRDYRSSGSSSLTSSDDDERQCQAINQLKPEVKKFNKTVHTSYFTTEADVTIKNVIYNVPRNDDRQRTYSCNYTVALDLTVDNVADSYDDDNGYYSLSSLQVVGSRFESQYAVVLDAYSDYFTANEYDPVDVRSVGEGDRVSGVLLWEFDKDYKHLDDLMLKLREFDGSAEKKPRYIDLPTPSFTK